jgi:hypothetical protein
MIGIEGTNDRGKKEKERQKGTEGTKRNRDRQAHWKQCCIAGNRPWVYCLPQSKIIMYSFIWGTALVYKIKEISSSALGLSMMTPRKCRID